MKFGSLMFSCLALTALMQTSVSAEDNYTCQEVSIPGAGSTYLWRLNNSGKIAGSANNEAIIYDAATGLWSSLPLPPGDPVPGYTLSSFTAFDINDNGVIVGSARFCAGGVCSSDPDSSRSRAFTLQSLSDPSSYTFFAPGDVPATESTIEFRGVNNLGLVTGWVYNGPLEATGFLLNLTDAPIAGFEPGFTTYSITDQDDNAATAIFPGGINDNNQFVGTNTWFFSDENGLTYQRDGFIADPANQRHTRFDLFDGFRTFTTQIRGINDLDPGSDANCGGGDNCLRVVGWGTDTSLPRENIAGYTVRNFWFDYEPATGNATPPNTLECGDLLAIEDDLFLQGINNNNLVTGVWSDKDRTNHGVIAYPNVVQPESPLTASSLTAAGSSSYSTARNKPLNRVQATTASYDTSTNSSIPVYLAAASSAGGADNDASGFVFSTGSSNPNFSAVTLPWVGDHRFTLIVGERAFSVNAGQLFKFTENGYPGGVERFEVLGREPGSIDTKFITGLIWTAAGSFTGTIQSLNAGDELDALADAAGSEEVADVAQRAADAYARNDTQSACLELGALKAAVEQTQPTNADELLARTVGAGNALDCGPLVAPPPPPAPIPGLSSPGRFALFIVLALMGGMFLRRSKQIDVQRLTTRH